MYIWKRLLIATTLLLTIYYCNIGSAAENAFYILRSNSPDAINSAERAYSSFTNHYNSINLLISQAYQVNDKGIVWGYLDPAIVEFAKQHNVKMMLLVTNAGFSKELAHKFLENPKAQEKAIQSILTACKQQHFYGVQFDFESVALEDRNALTQFYQSATDVLHKNNYIVSYAIAPVVSDNLQPSEFLKKIYVNWEGAYDFKKLGESADFVTIMAYNQHGDVTTPGPTAGIRWVDAVIQYALQYIPANKISLGIPTYSTYWFTGTTGSHGRLMPLMAEIDYNKVEYLLRKYNINLAWNDQDKLNYALYQHNWLYEYIFAEDAKSFSAKLALSKKYNLRGISVFDLGSEDPNIWNVLTAK